MEDLKVAFTKTKYFGNRKGGGRICEIPKWMNTPPKNGKISKEYNGKTSH